MTVTEVRGFGQQCGHQTTAHSVGRQVFVLRKLRIDVVVQDQAAAELVDSIGKAVSTGTIGDGKIWVCPVESCPVGKTSPKKRKPAKNARKKTNQAG
jgi:nitrogen regulatory protein P-II 1